jgi:hypothetical protein
MSPAERREKRPVLRARAERGKKLRSAAGVVVAE